MKVKKHLPSILTLTNLFLGFLAIIYIQNSEYVQACYFLFLASILDAMDGKLARKIGISSSFGKEIDSLADLISFCLAPSILVYSVFAKDNLPLLPAAAISSSPVIMGAIRLARFNLEDWKDSNRGFFVGLPTPANALAICAMVLLHYNEYTASYTQVNVILPIIVMLSFLMTSRISYSKFPILSININKANSIKLFSMFIMLIIIIISFMNDSLHISLIFFIMYYIIGGILLHFMNNSIHLNKLRATLKNRKRNK